MTSPLATGSGLDRLIACDGPAFLPRIDSTSDDADRGRAIHSFLETASASGRDVALGLSPESLRPALEALDLSRLPVDGNRYAAEVAFAYDVRSGKARELGRGIGRRYECAATEIGGTADVVALLEDDAVFVADWKSGWSRRAPAKENTQLRFYALAAARAYGRSRAVVQIIRIMEDGATWTDEAAFDAFDLDAFALELTGLADRIDAVRAGMVEPRLAEGPQCKWCPSFNACPAKVALLRAGALAPPEPAELTPTIAAEAYRRLRIYEAAVAKAKEILREYARTTPIPLEDGQVYGVRLDKTKSLDGVVAATVLREWFGEAATAGVTIEVTQAGIKRALKAAGNRGIKLEDVLAEIQKRGGLKTVEAPKLVEFKPAA
jgi:hypothetical protein